MTVSPVISIRTLSALVVVCTLAAILAQPAAAQNGGNLNCNGCIKSKQVKNNGIKGKDIRAGAVSNDKIAPDAIDSSKIADGAVGNADLAPRSVNSGTVANESLTAGDLSNEPRVEFAGGRQDLDLGRTPTVVRSVDLTAPTAGFAVVNASGTFVSSVPGTGRCSITTGRTVDLNNFSVGEVNSADNYDAFGMTRGFTVPAGTTSFRLVCEETIGDIELEDSQMTAMFFPSRY